MNSDNKNMFVAIAVCLGLLLGYNYLFSQQPQQPQAQTQGNVATDPSKPKAPVSVDPQPVVVIDSKADALTKGPRISLESESLKGSISLMGGRLDDVSLRKYKANLKPDAKDLELLMPASTAQPYFVDFGWISKDGALKMPGTTTPWSAATTTLTPTTPVTLTWDNGQGLVFKRVFAMDQNYMIVIQDSVQNTSASAVELYNYGLLSRGGTPPVSDFFILHEGPIGFLQGKLKEHDYKDLLKEKKISYETTGGWIGMTDKYWLAALIPDQKTDAHTSFVGRTENGQNTYQADFVRPAQRIEPGKSVTNTSHFFVGAKELSLLDAYSQSLNVPHLDRAVDFGWFYFITKPIFYALKFLHDLLGNFGLAILMLTILTRILFLPLANKSYTSMARMRAFQPEMKRLQALYKDDKARQQQELMALYKKHKINPASGCLPMLVQMPIFFALYKVLFISLEMRQAPFFGWIHDLSAADPTNVFTLFGLLPWDAPSFLQIGVLPVLMGISMFIQQKLNPQPMEAAQAKLFMIFPVFLTYVVSSMPAGAVLYWTWSNILGILQQAYIAKKAAAGTEQTLAKKR